MSVSIIKNFNKICRKHLIRFLTHDKINLQYSVNSKILDLIKKSYFTTKKERPFPKYLLTNQYLISFYTTNGQNPTPKYLSFLLFCGLILKKYKYNFQFDKSLETDN